MNGKKCDFFEDKRFAGIDPFKKKVWLSSPTMHGAEQRWVDEAIQTNWVSTVGENINVIEKEMAAYIGVPYTVALSAGTAALHLGIKLAGEKLYGQPKAGHGTLEGRKVFCSDMTFAATVNPVCYEGGECVFIDTERESWNMDPAALEKAFRCYPDVRLVVVAHLYGVPARIDEIRRIADRHRALVVEDAAESLGAKVNGIQTGAFGDVGIISFNGNKLITGSSGGMLLCRSKEDADKARKWSTQSRENANWYQHKELGYNYRMSNLIAGVVRGQIPYIDEHMRQKRAIYERYERGLADLPVRMNPIPDGMKSNYWLSCLLIDEKAMAPHQRGAQQETWQTQRGKSSPAEILEALAAFNIEGRPIWKPMHLQPIYRDHPFVTAAEDADVGADVFARGCCLPSDNKMTEEEQDVVIDIIHRCFM
nr:DegT/DnrJ/EryC1/StrS family aminotransferase [Clostridia bacterium]